VTPRFLRRTVVHGVTQSVCGGKLFIGKLEGKRPCKRPGHKWEGNIRISLCEIRWKGVNWIHPAQDRDQWWGLVNKVMNFWFP
jgi:hypothetical protein